ncbi:hypothetical protein Ancab_039514 [Ancistrocladus abbreviatus]
MDGHRVSPDQVVAELIDMGFEYPLVKQAIEVVGPALNEAVDYILNNSSRNDKLATTRSKCSTSNVNPLGKKLSSSSCAPSKMRQSSIKDHLQSTAISKKSRSSDMSDVANSRSASLTGPLEDCGQTKHPQAEENCSTNHVSESARAPSGSCSYFRPEGEVEIGSDWEQKVNWLLQKHFGFSSLKSFQKEALSAWLAHQDCLILAATGSGKSLCFQLPALLTGKVVVVISPLISLMHDQCLRLSKHGVSACFLGSGQLESSVEKKAMNGMYSIIYVCPETVVRLIKSLQGLAQNRGIALFAIDEVHCISKWGHDFRPDYRRLSLLRESFMACNLEFLEVNIPIMALTATATVRVREDILESLCMSNETKIVLTSFFRPNLRFSVKHSRTSSPSSYEKDFHELFEVYSSKRSDGGGKRCTNLQGLQNQSDLSSSNTDDSTSGAEGICLSEINNMDGSNFDGNNEVNSSMKNDSSAPKEPQLSVEYLEDDFDKAVDDLDVSCGEFYGQAPCENLIFCESNECSVPPVKPEQRQALQQGPLEHGPTIVYVPTRKETLRIAKFLSAHGVKAEAYNAVLPKSHLRRVHKEFHENALDVVVATIAFGMGIDKLNVRRIIHYGWPQSLEAYYQEAGRAGRDGKLADCLLYANLSRTPTLLPSQRSEEQTRQAYKMLTDCFRYGMNTSSCRAKILVEYFGEEFSYQKCLSCDVCTNGPPELQNLKAEASIFMQVVAAHYGRHSFADTKYDDYQCGDQNIGRTVEKPNIRMFVSRIREQSQKFLASDQLWWRGLARILEDKGLIQEGNGFHRVQIKCPEITEKGLRYLESDMEQDFRVYPEADMLLSTLNHKPFSSFSEWGKGWADPQIRRQRLEKRHSTRKPRKRKSSRSRPDLSTVRGRLAVKLSKRK